MIVNFTGFHTQNKHFWTYRAGRVAIVQYLALLRFFLDMSISTASWSYRLTSLQLEGPFLHSELEGFPCIWQHMTARICTGEHFDAPHCSDLQHRALQNVSREAGEQLGLTSWRRLIREVWKTYWFITTVGATNPLKRDHYIIDIVAMRKIGSFYGFFYGVTTKKFEMEFSHQRFGIHQETFGFSKKRQFCNQGIGIRLAHHGWILGAPASKMPTLCDPFMNICQLVDDVDDLPVEMNVVFQFSGWVPGE